MIFSAETSPCWQLYAVQGNGPEEQMSEIVWEPAYNLCVTYLQVEELSKTDSDVRETICESDLTQQTDLEARGTCSTSSALSILPPSSAALMVWCEYGTKLAAQIVNGISLLSSGTTFPDFLLQLRKSLLAYLDSLYGSFESPIVRGKHCWKHMFWASLYQFFSFLPLSIPLVSLPHICPLGLAQLRINIDNQLCLYGNSCTCWTVEQAWSRYERVVMVVHVAKCDVVQD